MNEYEDLIDYLNSIITDIDEKKQRIKMQNVSLLQIKDSLDNVLKLFKMHRLNDINQFELGKILQNFISNEEANNILNKISELLNLQSFLFDERISNPIKQIMLQDLENIITKLTQISSSIIQITISEEEDKLQEQCRKYLEIVSANGFIKVLSDEERIAFYDFIKTSKLENKLLLISRYISFANSNKKKIEIHTSNTAIDIVNKNAEEVIKELETNVKDKTEKIKPVEEIPVKTSLEKQQEEFKVAYEKIIELLNIHQKDINTSTYDFYKKYFEEMNIYEIYSNRSLFSTFDGVNWEIAIPCLKERLLPNINTEGQSVIFQIINEIIALNQDELKIAKEKKQREEEYKLELNKFNEEYKKTLESVKVLYSQISPIVEKVLRETNSNDDDINTLVDFINSLDTNDEIVEFLSSYNITYDEIKIYVYYDIIQKNLREINEYIGLEMLSPDDFKGIYQILEGTNNVIIECKDCYETYNKKIQEVGLLSDELEASSDEEDIDDEFDDTEEIGKQFEYGKSIIVFFRKNPESKFLVLEDIEGQIVNKKSYLDIYRILRKTSNTTNEMWGQLSTDSSGFKSYIDYNKQNGKRGPIVTIESDFSHEVYEFFRLKDKGKTNPRLSAFEIKMCEENRKKLGIPSQKPIILFIGEKQVTKYSNESQDYSDVRRELKVNIESIKKYIELFENPDTSVDVLYSILEDSNMLYEELKKKAKRIVKRK